MRTERPARRPVGADAHLCHEGEIWTIAYDGELLRLRDAKGLHYLALLLQHPGRPFHVAELITLADPPNAKRRSRGDVERNRKAVTNRIRQTMARIRARNDALGLHLYNSVHTGKVCAYTPERWTSWVFETV